MSKELDRLEHLRLGIQHINQEESPAFISQYEEDIDIIEKALKDYANKEKWINEIIDNFYNKKLKVLEIIKRDPLMICADYYKCIVELKLTYQEYLKYFPNEEDRAIKTQEEYDLLKEVLL